MSSHRLTSAVVAACAAALLASPAAAQSRLAPRPDSATSIESAKKRGQKARRERGWRPSAAAVVWSEFDDNVFLLPDSRREDVGSPSAGSLISGRYAGMQSSSDLVTTGTVDVGVTGPGLSGRQLELRAQASYHLYARNAERRHATLEASLEQKMPRAGRLRLRGELTPSYFSKNYLVDARDLSANGSIEAPERVYERADYSEHAVSADYRVRLDKSSGKSPFGASAQLGAGFRGRRYEAPFAGRDLSGPTADARLLLDLTRRVALVLGYDLALLSSSETEAVMIVDETDAARDLNGNGSSTDPNVRVLALTDRSRREQALGAEVRVELAPRLEASFSSERRWRRYTSELPDDYANNGRRDVRTELGAGLDVRLARGLSLDLRLARAAQGLERGTDANTGEIDDYARTRFAVGMRRSF